jgi:hypothetical protein
VGNIHEGAVHMTKQDNAEEVRNLLNRPKAGRPKKGSESPAVIGEKVLKAGLALNTSEAVVAAAGYAKGDPHFRDLQLLSMLRQGVSKHQACEILGFGPMQANRVLAKFKNNAKFRQKAEDMLNMSIDAYRKTAQSLLPEISALDVQTVREYQRDPSKLIERPKALANLRVAAGATLPDGAQVTQTISVTQIENLQSIFGTALLPGCDPVVDAEIVKDSK